MFPKELQWWKTVGVDGQPNSSKSGLSKSSWRKNIWHNWTCRGACDTEGGSSGGHACSGTSSCKVSLPAQCMVECMRTGIPLSFVCQNGMFGWQCFLKCLYTNMFNSVCQWFSMFLCQCISMFYLEVCQYLYVIVFMSVFVCPCLYVNVCMSVISMFVLQICSQYIWIFLCQYVSMWVVVVILYQWLKCLYGNNVQCLKVMFLYFNVLSVWNMYVNWKIKHTENPIKRS